MKMKKIPARVGAGTLALATVVAGLSFGPAAANAAPAANGALAADAATSPEFQLIWKDGATYYTNVYSTKPSDGSRSDLQSFPSIDAAREAGVKLTYDDSTKQIKGPYSTCFRSAASSASSAIRDTWLTTACGTGKEFKWTFDADGTLHSDFHGGTYKPGATSATYGITRAKLTTSTSWETVASLTDLSARVAGTDLAARTADLTGTAKPSSTVIINDTIPVPVGADGQWSYTITGLHLGKNDIKLEQYEGENKTDETTVVADLAVAPIVANATFLSDVTKPLVILGTAQPGANVEIWQGTTKLAAVPAEDGTGAYSTDIPAPNAGGEQTYTVKQVLQGETAPDVATVTADFGAPVSITSPLDNQVHDGGPLRFQGRGVPSGKVEVREQGKQGIIGRADVLPNGIWTIDAANIPGKNATYVATQTGKGNNVTTSAVTLNPDGGLSAPIVDPVAEGSNVVTGSDATPDTTIIVRDTDGNEIGHTTVDKNGTWSVTIPPALGPGKHNLDVVAQDGEEVSDPTAVTVDFGAAVDAMAATSDDNGIMTYTGTGQKGAAIKVMGKSGRVLATGDVEDNGSWNITSTISLPAGKYTIDVFQTTGIGVTSSDEIAFEIRKPAPTAKAVTFTGPAANTTVRTQTPEFSGQGEAGAKVVVKGSSRTIAETEVGQDGTWSVPSSIALNDGLYSLTAVQTPANGAAASSATNSFRIDTRPAAHLVVTSPTPDEAVEGPRPTFGGTGDKDAKITIKGAVRTVAETFVGDNGAWTAPSALDLPKGKYTFTVTQDALNGETESTTVTFTVK